MAYFARYFRLGGIVAGHRVLSAGALRWVFSDEVVSQLMEWIGVLKWIFIQGPVVCDLPVYISTLKMVHTAVLPVSSGLCALVSFANKLAKF